MKVRELTERHRIEGCMYCKKNATKGFVWADGRAIIWVCDDHHKKARHQIEKVNNDKVSTVKSQDH